MSSTDAGRSTPGKPASNQGVSLRAVLDSARRLDELSCARLIATLAEALHAANKSGQATGPITPSAVMVQADASIRFTAAPPSPRYTAPEKQGGAASDRRSDVFALGAILWEALARAKLFDGPTDEAIARAATESAIRSPSELNANVPAELDAICKRALARDPAERYQSPKVMAAEIDAVLGDAGYPDSNERIVRFLAAMTVPAESISAAWTLPPPASQDRSSGSVPRPVRTTTSGMRPAATEILGSMGSSASLRAPGASGGTATPPAASGSAPSAKSQPPVTAIFGSNASAPTSTAATGSGSRAPLATTAFLGSNASAPADPAAPSAADPAPAGGAPVLDVALVGSSASAAPRSATARQPTGAAREPTGATREPTGAAREPTGATRPATGAASSSPALGVPSFAAAPATALGTPAFPAASAFSAPAPSLGPTAPTMTQPSFAPPEMPAPVVASVTPPGGASVTPPGGASATPPGGARAQTTSSEFRHALPAPFRSRQTSPVAAAETVETPRHASQPVIAPGAQLDMPPGITVPPSSPPVPLLSADVSSPNHASVAEALARHRNDRTTGGRDLLAGWGWTTGSTQALVDDEDDFTQVARASRKRLVLAIGGAFGAVAILAAVAFLFSGSPPAADLQAQLGLHLPTGATPTGSTAPAAGDTAAVPAAASAPTAAASAPAAAPPAPSDPAATAPAGSAAPAAPPPAESGATAPPATGEPMPAAGSAAAPAVAETGSAKAAADSPAPVAEAAATPAPESRTRAGSAKPAEAPRPVAAATPGKAGKTSGDPAKPARVAGDATRSNGRSSAESGRSANGSTRPGESGRSTPRTESSRGSDARKSDAKKVATATQKRPGSRDPLARTPGKGQPIDPYSTGAADRSRVDPAAAYRAGLQQYAHGDTTAALSTFRSSLVANPSYAPTWRGLGLVYEKLGNKTQARAAFKRYLQLSPNAGDADQIRDRMERLGS